MSDTFPIETLDSEYSVMDHHVQFKSGFQIPKTSDDGELHADDFYDQMDDDKICEYDPYNGLDAELTFNDLHGQLEEYGFDDDDHDADHLDAEFYAQEAEVRRKERIPYYMSASAQKDEL